MTSRLLVSSCSLAALTKRVGQLTLNFPNGNSSSRLLLQGGGGARPVVLAVPPSTSFPPILGNARTNTTIARSSSLVSPSSSRWTTALLADWLPTSGMQHQQQRRSLASKAKKQAKRERKALGLDSKHKKKKDAKKTATAPKVSKNKKDDLDNDDDDDDDEYVAPQHEAWVDFQKGLSVDGFETGQTTKARTTKKSSTGHQLRDLKRREKVERKLQAHQQELVNVRGGEMPIERFSDEETERLLALAYANIPPRAGKRGTKNLKRQNKRWFLVRKIHKKQKRWRIAAHGRRMDTRSRRVREAREIKDEAPDIRERDRAYQREVLQRWAANLILDGGDDGPDGERQVIQAETTVRERRAIA